MKHSWMLGLLAVGGLAARGEIPLGPGGQWTYEFASLAYDTSVPRASSTWDDPGVAVFELSGWESSDRFVIELFESAVTEVPAVRFDSTTARDLSSPFGLPYWRGWYDLQGVVRISVMEGEVSLIDLDLWKLVALPEVPGFQARYGAASVVPEPGAAGLMFLGGLALVGIGSGRRSRLRRGAARAR